MKLKNLFAITAIASALALTGCKEEKKADATSTAPAATSIKVGVMAGPEHQVAETAAKVAKDKYNLNVEFVLFNDYALPNTAVSKGDLDANAMQHNPYIKEKMDLDVQVSKLKLLKANHTSQIYRLESDIAKNFPVQISALKERIAGMQVDSQVVKSVDLQDNDTFAMTVGNVLYEDKKEAGEALIAACAGLKTVSTGGKVGEYHGFTLSASYNMFSNAFELTVKGKCSYKLEIGKDPVGNMQRIHNTLSSIDRKLTESEQKLETVQQQLATAQEEVKKPFPKEAELNEKMERLSELNALLNMDEKGNETIMADEDIGREGSSTDSRDAVEEKELPETADRIHKPSILERLKQEKAQQNAPQQPTVQKSAKKKHEQEL